MLPPGHQLQRALAEGARGGSKPATLPKAYWAWDEIVEMNKGGYWPVDAEHQPAVRRSPRRST